MNIAFFWTWDFSKNILKDILSYEEVNVRLLVSQPDKEVWRKKEILATPVKKLSLEKWLQIVQARNISGEEKDELIVKLKSLELDFIVVVAYWKIIPKEILDIPKYGSINIHGSILPKYRWASPIQEALKNWEKSTWLTIMYMSEMMDEWDILAVEEIEVDIVDKTPDIFEKFEKFWAKLLLDTLKKVINWSVKWIKQDNSKATYCKKIEKENWKIDFKKETSSEIYNKFRAYYTWPWIFTFLNWKKFNLEEIFFDENIYNNLSKWEVIKLDNWNIWIVCADKKAIILKKVKLEWKKSLNIKDFLNWNKNFIWTIL